MDDRDERMTDDGLLERMRRAPVLAGPLPEFDPERADDTPGPLFASWLAHALDSGVPEPHVMTLSTADTGGRPSARVLMLRGVDIEECGFVFASDSGTRKGRELAANPYATLTWYWPRQGRQIRMTGRVGVLGAEAARRDFLGRGEASRISGFTGRTSAPLAGPEEYERERRRAAGLVAADPQAVPEGHTVYVLRAEEAEFFQGDSRGLHVRLRYARDAGGSWNRGLLWP